MNRGDKMKVLIVQNTDWLKRYPAQQHHLAEMLSIRGHEVRVIDFEILWRKSKRELRSKRLVFTNVSKIHSNADVTVVRPGIIKMPLLDYVSMMFSHWKEIRRQIREFAPDVVVSLGIVAYLVGREARKNRTSFVYYWVDVSHRLIPFRLLQPIGWVTERRALKLADKIFVINNRLREYVTKIGAPGEKTRVLTAGIDFAHFNLHIGRDKIGKQYGLSKKDIVLFFMGWLYQFSGLIEVAWQLAKLKDKRVKLLIVGEGDAYEELDQLREKLNMQNRIILTGRRPYSEIPAFIAASDICLLPAHSNESIMQNIVPIKMYEYMAMGKPVIASRLPGVLKEFGENNGVIYVDRPEDAVEKALELVHKGNVEDLGARARNFVQKYSWENIANQFEKALEESVRQTRQMSKIDSRVRISAKRS